MNSQSEPAPTGRAFYDRVATDAGQNMAYVPFALGFFWMIAHIWPSAGRVLFWLAAAFMAYTVFHFAVVILAGILVATTRNEANTRWHWASLLIRFVELIWFLSALWLAAYIVGYWPLSSR